MILIVRQTVYDKVCKHCSFKMKNRIHLSLVDLFNVKKNLVLSGIFFLKIHLREYIYRNKRDGNICL